MDETDFQMNNLQNQVPKPFAVNGMLNHIPLDNLWKTCIQAKKCIQQSKELMNKFRNLRIPNTAAEF